MKTPSNKTGKWLLVCIITFPLMLAPLAAAFMFLRYKVWLGAILSIVMFFVLRRISWKIEDHFGIYSPSNPKSSIYGSGITFYAPWLQRKIEKEQKEKTHETNDTF